MNSEPLVLESEISTPPRQKKYWSGNLRIVSDLMWCILISLLLMWSSQSHHTSQASTIPNSSQIGQYIEESSQSGDYLKPRSSAEAISHQISSIFGRVVGCFFIFFFWSWNREHLKCRSARIAIHFLCWTMFIIAVITLAFLGLYFPRSLSEYTGWYVLILTIVWSAFIIRKYKGIMWPNAKQVKAK